MTNNEMFKHMLSLTGLMLEQDKIIEIFKLAGNDDVSRSKIRGWRSAEPDSRDYVKMSDSAIHDFIQGLYRYRDQQAEKGVMVFDFDIKSVKAKIDTGSINK